MLTTNAEKDLQSPTPVYAQSRTADPKKRFVNGCYHKKAEKTTSEITGKNSHKIARLIHNLVYYN